MNSRIKAGIGILAIIGAFSCGQMLSGRALAQDPPPPQQGGGYIPGRQGGGFGGQRGGMQNNMTAKITIDQAIKTALAQTPGFANSAVLRPAGRPGGGGPPQGGGPGGSGGQGAGGALAPSQDPTAPPQGDGPPPQKMIWVVHVVTTPATSGPASGKGQNIGVDATTGEVTAVPAPPRGGGGGGFGGGQGGPPPNGGGQGGPPPAQGGKR